MIKTVHVSITGMHCASCVSVIERTLSGQPGVQEASANFGTEKAKILFDPALTNLSSLNRSIEPLGYSLHEGDEQSKEKSRHDSQREKMAELKSLKIKTISIIPLAIISALVMAWEILAGLNILPMIPAMWMDFFHHLLPVMATYSLFVVGLPYLKGLQRFLRHGQANMDTLIGLGTLTAFIYSFIIASFSDQLRAYINVEAGYYDVTIVVIAFITLGKYLEMRSKIKTGDALAKLIGLQAKTALILRDGRELEVPAEEVRIGDVVIIKPAGKIPVDGIIISGSSFLDESLVTGESLPIEKNAGDAVLSGTINTTGSFNFRATKIGSDTMLARIIKMVEEAQGSKAPIQALADKISAVFVPLVLILAFVALGAWLVIGTPSLDFSQALSYGLVSFVNILVIACPCALGLATPTAIIVGVGKGAKEGILIKDAAALEKLHQADILVTDKTGTITQGRPELVDFKNFSTHSDEDLLSLLSALENLSEHPIASAIVEAGQKKKLKLPTVENFTALKGLGLSGQIQGTKYYAGNTRLIKSLGFIPDERLIEAETKKGRTPIIIASEQEILGIALVADPIKPEAIDAIKNLRHLNIEVIMLTGDHKNTAEYIAAQAGIARVISEASPEDKLNKIKELQANGQIVAMAGDGINDAPALAQADIGIAMATGTDVAIESAGVTLLHGDISKTVKAIHLSKIIMRGVKQNLFWAFIYNVVGIPLASGLFFPVFGWLLSPVFAGFAMGASSVSVIGNSLRLKSKKL